MYDRRGATLVSAALGAAFGLFIASRYPSGQASWFLINMALSIAVGPLCIALHEAGHALVARIAGLRVSAVVPTRALRRAALLGRVDGRAV